MTECYAARKKISHTQDFLRRSIAATLLLGIYGTRTWETSHSYPKRTKYLLHCVYQKNEYPYSASYKALPAPRLAWICLFCGM